MNLKEIMDDNYKVFGRMNEENRLKHIDIIRYIDTIVNSTHIDVSKWNIMEIFGLGEGNKLITDQNEINRIFFEFYQKSQEGVVVEKGSVGEQLQKRINDLSAQALAKQLADIEARRNNFVREAKDHYTRYEERMKHAWEETLNLEAHKKEGGIDIAAQVNAIVAENFWTNPVVEGHCLYLCTRQNVIMTSKNEAAGINVRADLGKFAVKVYLDSMTLRVIPLDNNVHVANHTHPYISERGEICWGNAKSTAQAYQTRGDLTSLMRLLATLLSTFVHGSQPYRGLELFVGRDARKIDPLDRTTHPHILNLERSEREQQLQRERQYKEQPQQAS